MGRLADQIASLDDLLVADVEAAASPLAAPSVKQLAQRLRDVAVNADDLAQHGFPQAASLKDFCVRTAEILEKASQTSLIGPQLKTALTPISTKLDEFAALLRQMLQQNGAL